MILIFYLLSIVKQDQGNERAARLDLTTIVIVVWAVRCNLLSYNLSVQPRYIALLAMQSKNLLTHRPYATLTTRVRYPPRQPAVSNVCAVANGPPPAEVS